MATAWFRRGDGARFEVPEDSEAYAMLVAQGSVRISGPDAAASTAGSGSVTPAPTKKELLARAAELGIEGLKPSATNAVISEAIAAKEAELAAAAPDSGDTA